MSKWHSHPTAFDQTLANIVRETELSIEILGQCRLVLHEVSVGKHVLQSNGGNAIAWHAMELVAHYILAIDGRAGATILTPQMPASRYVENCPRLQRQRALELHIFIQEPLDARVKPASAAQ